MSNYLYFCIIMDGINDYCNSVISATVDSLLKGGVIVYPTDTIWGIGCDATNSEAVQKIFSLKKREPDKSMLILCSDIKMVERYVAPVDATCRQILLESGCPTTLIMPLQCDVLARELVATDNTIGVRIPQMAFCQQLIATLDRPLVSTSANFSGCGSPSCFSDIDPRLIDSADYCVPPSMDSGGVSRPSRIVKRMPDGSLLTIRK